MSESQSNRLEAKKLFAEYRRLELIMDKLEYQGTALLQQYRAVQLDDVKLNELMGEIDQNFQQQQAILKHLFIISARLGLIFQEEAKRMKEKL